MAFDLKTQRLNKKGQVTAKQPYRLYIDKGVSKFERPPGSGYFYSPDGSLLSSPKPVVESKKEEKLQVQAKPEQKEAKSENKDMADLKADLKQDLLKDIK